MKTLLILALLAAGLALGCRAEDAVIPPTPVTQAEEGEGLAQMLEHQVTATPEPTPTPYPTLTPPSVGICYRTPAVQDWILSRLQIRHCQTVNSAELYRITEPVGFTQLKAGDLAGMVNVPSLVMGDPHYGHCGDWTDPEYVSAILDGFNPDAEHIRVNAVIGGYPRFRMEWPRDVIFGYFLKADSVAVAQRQIGQNVHETEIDRLGEATMARLKQQALTLREQVNGRALAIAEAVKAAQGFDDSVELAGFGAAVVGKEPDDIRYSPVYVVVNLVQDENIPECPEG